MQLGKDLIDNEMQRTNAKLQLADEVGRGASDF
jgi:hypothetical protein